MQNADVVREEVRRDDDDELVGFVQSCPDPDGVRWRALSVFGGLLAEFTRISSASKAAISSGSSVSRPRAR